MEPLVMIHGAVGASWRDFAPLLPQLEEARDLIVLRTPGHYEAEELPAKADLRIDSFVDLLEAELDERGLTRPDIVGDSTGGLFALELGRRGRARAVVAISPAGMWTEEEARKAERNIRLAYRMARRTLPLGTLAMRTTAGRWVLFSTLLGTRGARLSSEDAAHVLRALADSSLPLDFIDANRAEDGRLARAENPEEIRCPVLIIWGEQDRLMPAAQGRRWAEALPNAELQELQGVGHHPFFDQPEQTAELILEFLGRR